MREWFRAIAWFLTPRMIRHENDVLRRELFNANYTVDSQLKEIDFLLDNLNVRNQECEALRLTIDKQAGDLARLYSELDKTSYQFVFALNQLDRVGVILSEKWSQN